MSGGSLVGRREMGQRAANRDPADSLSLTPDRWNAATVPAQRWAVPIAGAVALFTFALLQLIHHLVPGTGADLRAMLQGATDLAAGRNIYAPALHFLAQGELRTILSMPVTVYVYPPPLAMVLRPLSHLPSSDALMVWDALNVGLLGLLFVLIIRVSRVRSWRQLLLVGAIYGFFPLNMGLGTGQIDILLTLLGLVIYLLYHRGMLRRAGIVLGLMALIKPTIGVLLLFFICRRAWPVVVSCAVTLLAGGVASLAAVGWSVLWRYRNVTAGWANDFGVLPLNQSPHGLILRLLSPRLDAPPTGGAALLAGATEWAIALGVITLVARLLRHREPESMLAGALQYYAIFALLLLGLPFTENLHLVWLLPGVGILFVKMAQQGRWHPWHAWASSAYLLLALPFAESICWAADSSAIGRLTSSIECYGLLALAGTFTYVAFDRGHRLLRVVPWRRATQQLEAEPPGRLRRWATSLGASG